MSDMPPLTPAAQQEADQHAAAKREADAWAATEAAVNAPSLAKLIDPSKEQFLTALISTIRQIDPKPKDGVSWLIADLMAETSLLAALVMQRVQEATRFIEPTYAYLPLLEILKTVTQTMEILIEELAVQAIQRKVITRREAAGALGVHENTVARWVKEKEKLSKFAEPPPGVKPGEPWMKFVEGPNTRIIRMRNLVRRQLLEIFPDLKDVYLWAADNNRIVIDELTRRLKAGEK